jgi:nicotinamide mononucleotide adenylyltransferase
MFLAEEIPTWPATLNVLALLGTLLSVGCAALMVYYMRRQADLMAEQIKQMVQPATQNIAPQPLQVKITEEMHERFAGKDEFANHVAGNTLRHAEMFGRIDTAQSKARLELAEAIKKIDADRDKMLDKFNAEFTFIRESLSAINTELKLKRRQ